MSHRTAYYDHHHPRPEPARHQQAPVIPRRAQPLRTLSDYTIVHAGRQVRLGPVAFWTVVGSLVVMAIWSVATGTYFAFYDDVLKRLIARQAEMQYAYEDRIAELRGRVDRISSRQLLDQEQFEQKLNHILSRQTALENRATALNNLPDQTTTGSIKPAGRGAEPSRIHPLKPSPISENGTFFTRPDHRGAKSGVEGVLTKLSESLDRVETKQMSNLARLEENYDGKIRKIRGVLADIGIDAGKAPMPAPGPVVVASAAGGPFVPMRVDSGNFDRQIYRVNVERSQYEKLTRTLAAIPVRKPVFGEIDMSSPFGARMDPFLKGPAIHTGIDMRGDIGDPVRATATGKVSVAGWNGGYGKMVEIDHGNGLATRYGHLSEIDVNVGDNVRIGQIVGKIGSTGRSTGPHLHYETRVDGEAVNPEKFLRAGTRLGAS